MSDLSELVNKIHCCDALELLAKIPSESVDCVVTSPPYFGLRDYGVAGQIGLEPTPALYVQTLVTLFREVRRVLKDSGTFWLNLGDTYASSGRGTSGSDRQSRNKGALFDHSTNVEGLASKNLLLIPHRVAIALQDDGWICRQDNVWAKPNPMPESVTDRTTRAHEYVFQFAKSGKYYYNTDAVKEKAVGVTGGGFSTNYHNEQRKAISGGQPSNDLAGVSFSHRNKRSVWTINPANFRDAHFATFPLELPTICIKAGCPTGGLVLDPFMGSGTVALVARSLGCDYIGSELNADYVAIARKRLAIPFTPMMPLFLEKTP